MVSSKPVEGFRAGRRSQNWCSATSAAPGRKPRQVVLGARVAARPRRRPQPVAPRRHPRGPSISLTPWRPEHPRRRAGLPEQPAQPVVRRPAATPGATARAPGRGAATPRRVCGAGTSVEGAAARTDRPRACRCHEQPFPRQRLPQGVRHRPQALMGRQTAEADGSVRVRRSARRCRGVAAPAANGGGRAPGGAARRAPEPGRRPAADRGEHAIEHVNAGGVELEMVGACRIASWSGFGRSTRATARRSGGRSPRARRRPAWPPRPSGAVQGRITAPAAATATIRSLSHGVTMFGDQFARGAGRGCCRRRPPSMALINRLALTRTSMRSR